jgi:hypothetical protein
MLQNVFPVTIVSDFHPVIDELSRCYPSIPFNAQSPVKPIPGLITQQYLIPNEMELSNIMSSYRVWVHFHRNNFPQARFPVGQSELRFGSFADLMTFNSHRTVRDINIEFDEKRVEILLIQSQYRLRLSEDCLDKYFVIDRSETVFLPLKKPARCFER